MNAGSHTSKWLMAVGLLAGFVLAFFLDLTGLEIHQWLGLAVGLAAVVHGWVHRAWIAAMARRLWTAGTGQGRLFFFLDAALLAGLAAIVGTGLLISSWLGTALADDTFWVNAHIVAALVTLGAVVAKVGTHWRWLATTTHKQFGLGRPASVPVQPARPGVSPAGPSRREFLGLMGMMTVAAAAATFRAVEAVAGPTGTASAPAATSTTVATSSTAASTCTVRCDRGCRYPGHCRRYTDANGNGRCDLGECA